MILLYSTIIIQLQLFDYYFQIYGSFSPYLLLFYRAQLNLTVMGWITELGVRC